MTSNVITYHRGVGRWKPDARERLRKAALDLFSEQGFAVTTVPQITERAGLTTRTFYRHFADKRDVVFLPPDAYAEMRAVLEHAPAGLNTAGFLSWGLGLLATSLEGQRDEVRLTRKFIDSDAGLQERALHKREMLCSVVNEALLHRGLGAQQARLLADTVISALYIALNQWRDSDTDVRVDVVALEALALLRENLDGI
jgi:AcrR family transcriptional regulator